MTNQINTALFTMKRPDPGPWTCGWQTLTDGEHWRCGKDADFFLTKLEWLDQWNEVVNKYAAKHKRTILIPIYSVGFCERHAITFVEWKGTMEAMADEGDI
jgi:hypothetical protein